MRVQGLLATLLLIPVNGWAALAPQGTQVQRLFLSPMGEPFRGGEESAPEQDWFRGADADRDGRLTADEMVDDGARFFRLLDVNADGEIDPKENERYEIDIAPEVMMRETLWRDTEPDSHTGGPQPQRKYRHGGAAAQFSYIDIPQPIMSADTSFNRGVSATEFRRAAQQRFDILDGNRDGKLDPAELPVPKRKKTRRR